MFICSDQLSAEDIQRVVESISDYGSYYGFNVRPVEDMLSNLLSYFDREKPTPNFSLQLRGGGGGGGSSSFSSSYSSSSYYNRARDTYGLSYLYDGFSSSFRGGGAHLNHDHSTQFTFVMQTLSLWREVMARLPKLWFLADMDMTMQPYRLANTGQGYHRVQQCPRVSAEMQNILATVKASVKSSWVGLSVVHLGDRDVPNGETS